MRRCNIQKTNTLRTFRKCVANTPKWIAKHSARRRGPIHRARILASSNTCIHFIEYIFNHHQLRAFTLSNTHIHFTSHAFPSPFCGCLRIRGHYKSAPTVANGLPKCCEQIAITLLTVCQNATKHAASFALRTTMPQHTNIKNV